MDKETFLEYIERKYRSLIKMAVMCVKDVDAAQDVFHDVLLVLLAKGDEMNEVDNYSAFISVCIHRAALNYLRKQSRASTLDPATLAEILAHPESTVQYDYIEWVITLEKHLAKYSAEMRRAFVEHYIDGILIEDIAQRLGITTNALSLRFMRMRETLVSDAPDMLRQLNVLMLL